MKLDELNLDIAGVVSAPIKITSAQPDWVQARRSRAIPESLFKLYEAAGYLSFDAAPKFLADSDKILFSYFSMVLRGVRQQLTDIAESLAKLGEAHALVYDPIKKAKGLPWDPRADRRSKAAFHEIIIAAYSSLDMLAEILALMFTGLIPGLTVGRAQFSSIEDWLRKPARSGGIVLSPQEATLADLRLALTPLIMPSGPEQDWLPLVRMLRNKGAHLGDEVFRYFGLFGPDDNLYLFIPREWPYFFEQDMKPDGEDTPEPFPQFLLRTLIHQDHVSFAKGLAAKIRTVVASVSEVTCTAFNLFGGFELNQVALDQLRTNSRTYSFEYFLDTGE